MSSGITLVNRDYELSLFKSALTRRGPDSSGTVVVGGGVGCGKSVLLEQFVDYATAQGAVLLRASRLRSDAAQQQAMLRQWLSRLAAHSGDAPGGPADSYPDPYPERRGRLDIEHDIVGALERVDAGSPVVVCVDDLQDGDREPLYQLLQLTRRGRCAPMLLVFADSLHLSHQDPLIKTELLRQSNSLRIRIDPFDERSTAEMMARCGFDVADRVLVQRMHTISGGNPLLLRALAEECRPAEPGPAVADRLTVGGPYGQAVLTCLHRSGPVALQVGEAVAVLGGYSSPELLVRMLDQPAALVEQNLRALDEAGVLDGARLRHEVAAATILAYIPSERLDALHHKAAAALYSTEAPAPVIAHHLRRVDCPDEPWALITLRSAAEEALSRDDAATAIDCLERAAAFTTSLPERVEIQLRLGLIMWRLNPAAAEYRYLPPLLSVAADGKLSPQALNMLGRLLITHGRLAETRALLGGVQTDADADADAEAPADAKQPDPGGIHPDVAALWVRYGFHGVDLPDDENGRSAADLGGAGGLSAQVPGIPLLRRSLPTLFRDCTERGAPAAANFLAVTPLTDHTVNQICAALKVLAAADQIELAAHWCERMLAESRRRDIPGWQATFATFYSAIAFRQGRLYEAAERAQSALDIVPEVSGSVLVCGTASVLALALTELGRHEAAAQQLDRLIPEPWTRSLYWLGYLRARGRLFLTTDRPHAALSDFLQIGRLAGQWGLDDPAMVVWRADAAEAWLRLGEPGQVRLVLAGMTGHNLPAGGNHLRAVLARLHSALLPPAERPALLTRAVDELSASGAKLELAKTLADLSDVYRELGELTRADVVRRRARHLAEECGAVPLAARLDPAGRPEVWRRSIPMAAVRPHSDPAGQLTRAEHRVAALAALGRTNREISQALYITVSTVEQHLTRTYQKLHIAGRHEIPVDL